MLMVAVSLTAVLIVAIPAVKELARAARSAEKLFDTLSRELPPTLESIRLTGMEISDLTEEVSEGVQRASQVAKQIDQNLETAREQVKGVQVSTRSLLTGLKAGWQRFTQPQKLPLKVKAESWSAPVPYGGEPRRRMSRSSRLAPAEDNASLVSSDTERHL